MAVIIVALSGAVGLIAMPALGALILAGFSSIKLRDIRFALDTGWPSWLAGGTTFVSMLFLPIQAAVGFGVVLSAFLYINRSSTDVALVQLTRRDDGVIEERRPAGSLASETATVLDVYGHLLVGVQPEVHAQITRTNRLDLTGPVTILEATPARGESTLQAVAESRAWLAMNAPATRPADP